MPDNLSKGATLTLEVKGLCKSYGSRVAVDDISFFADKGGIVGFLGPNGAGKSTTMNIITGYLSATSGEVRVNGFEILEQPVKAKAKIGYLPENPPLYPDMTVKEYLGFVHDLKRAGPKKEARISEACERTGIGEVYTRVIKNLSKGYKQRVGIAQALLGTPELIILDEPVSGLDPKQIVEMRELIRSLGEEHTVMLSSHLLTEVQAVCDRIIVIHKGRIVADDTTGALSLAGARQSGLLALIPGQRGEILTLLKAIPGVGGADTRGLGEEPDIYEYEIHPNPGKDIRRELFFALSGRGIPLLGLRSAGSALEDVFLQLTAGEASGKEEE